MEKALDYTTYYGIPQDEQKQLDDMKIAILSNLAACYNKLDEFNEAIDACNKGLEVSPKNGKLLYRLGMAYRGAGDYPNATKTLNAALEVRKYDYTLPRLFLTHMSPYLLVGSQRW